MSLFRTVRPESSGGLAFSDYVRWGVLTLCTVLLTSCAPALSLLAGSDKSNEPSRGSAAAPSSPASVSPSSQLENAPSDAITLEPLRAGPPGAGEKALLPGSSGLPYTPDGLPALQPARGIKLETLFAEKINNTGDRISRVENAVVDLRRDFEAILPAVVRLAAVEKDMQELIGQLETLLHNEPPYNVAANPGSEAPMSLNEGPAQLRLPDSAGSAVPRAPGAVPPVALPQKTETVATAAQGRTPPAGGGTIANHKASPQKVMAPAPKAMPAGLHVSNLRIGEHKDKTRLVLDVSGPVALRHDMDNGENLLVLEIPDAAWAGPRSWTGARAPLLSAWSVQPMEGGGSRVIMSLKHPATVVKESTLKPGNGYAHYRVILDLKGEGVHG